MAGKESSGNHPPKLNRHREAIVLFNNLSSIPTEGFLCPESDEDKADLALELDRVMRENAPAGWLGDETREKQILNTLFPISGRDRTATSAVFELIKNQQGYQWLKPSSWAISRFG